MLNSLKTLIDSSTDLISGAEFSDTLTSFRWKKTFSPCDV